MAKSQLKNKPKLRGIFKHESLITKSSRTNSRTFGPRLSQASMEYLMVIALTFAIMVPTTYLFYNYSKESGQQISDAQATKIGRNIVDTSETIFYSGQGSKTIIELNIPDNVRAAQIMDGREFVLNISTAFGISELVFFSGVNMTTESSACFGSVCQLPGLGNPGLKKVKIEAIDRNSVTI